MQTGSTFGRRLRALRVTLGMSQVELARRIGIMEEVLWVQALSLSHLISPILELLAQAIGRSLAEFRTTDAHL